MSNNSFHYFMLLFITLFVVLAPFYHFRYSIVHRCNTKYNFVFTRQEKISIKTGEAGGSHQRLKTFWSDSEDVGETSADFRDGEWDLIPFSIGITEEKSIRISSVVMPVP